MKIKKEILIPSLLAIFTLLGLEFQVLPYIPFGAGRWIDSISSNTSNRKMEVRGDINITGQYKINGSVITGGGGAAVLYDTIYSRGKDSTKFLTMRNRDNTFVGVNIFNGITYTGVIETGNATVNGTLNTQSLHATDSSSFVNDVTIAGFMQMGELGSNIKTKFLKFATTSASVPAYVNVAHGLPGKQLVNLQTLVKCDTTGWNITGAGTGNDPMFPPRCPLSAAITYDIFYDSLYVSIYLYAASLAIRNNTDSAFVWITYRE